jgi:hypothetical protein
MYREEIVLVLLVEATYSVDSDWPVRRCFGLLVFLRMEETFSLHDMEGAATMTRKIWKKCKVFI